MVTVVIVFNSGAVVELPADLSRAENLVGDFTNNWDAKGVVLVGDLKVTGGAIYRMKPLEISAVMIKP